MLSQADAESQQAGGGGLSLGLLREMTGSPRCCVAEDGSKITLGHKQQLEEFCICTEVDPEAQLIVSFNARSE